MWNDIPEGFSLLEEEKTGAFSDIPEGFSVTDSPPSWRAEIMSELDENPATKRLTLQMLDTEGGGVATMEALVNRTAMIRQKVPDWTLGDELTSGFYGPINRGYAQTRDLHPKTIAKYEQDIDEVRAGSNVIQGRTDQGYPGDPNWRGPGRVHVADNPKEVYNYWVGRRRGVDFSHADSARFAEETLAGGPKFADTGSDAAKRAVIEQRGFSDIPEGFAVSPEQEDRIDVPELDQPAYTDIPEGFKVGTIGLEATQPPTPNQTRTATNRNRLSTAITKAEKEGYTVPHFIGTPDEPEGDRAPTRDMESLVKALALQEENAIRAGQKDKAAQIRQERSYWEDHIAKYGMTAEQWKKQTGEEDPRYPSEPAFQASQSPPELIDSVESAINAGKEAWGAVQRALPNIAGGTKRGLMSSELGLGETVNRYAFSPIVHGIREAIDYAAPGSDLAKFAKYADDEFYKNTVEIPATQRKQLGEESAKAGFVGEVAHATGQMAGDLPSILLTSGLLPELKGGIDLVNALRHGAASMTLPAMRGGTDAAEEVKKKGGGEVEQFGAFVKATSEMMAVGALPMATSSKAATRLGRFAERAVKSVPVGAATVEVSRATHNLVSAATGDKPIPFDIKETIKGTIPLALLGGAMGRSTNVPKSKFEKTYGFKPESLEKTDWIRKKALEAGVAKVTPEQVMEWGNEWAAQRGQAVQPGEFPQKGYTAVEPDQYSNATVTPPIETPGPAREAFHGSPHEFSEFSTEKIGTGEGAQAFGYGHYVAQNKGVAQDYFNRFQQLAEQGGEAGSMAIRILNATKRDANAAIKEVERRIADLERRRKESPQTVPENMREGRTQLHDALDILKEGKDLGAHLYHVKVKGDEANYLDWDKPLKEQSEDVQAALSGIVPKGYEHYKGEDIYNLMAKPAAVASDGRITPKNTSAFLQGKGILGIRYLDQGSRFAPHAGMEVRKVENGWAVFDDSGTKVFTYPSEAAAREAIAKEAKPQTRNYVVFDPKNIEILSRNGKVAGTADNPPAKGPQDVKRSPQALGIVADPRAAKGFEAAREEAKAIADFINKSAHWTPFNESLGNLIANKQKTQDEVVKQATALKKLAPSKEGRKGIAMFVEAGGDINKIAEWGTKVKNRGAKDAYKAAGALTPGETQVAKTIMGRLGALLQEAKANGIDIQERQNYITHLLHNPGADVVAGTTRGISDYFRFKKPRQYDTFFDAFQGGAKPKTLDAVDILSVYESTLREAINNKKFVEGLKAKQASDGRPILAPTRIKYEEGNKDYKEIPNVPGMGRLVVHPEHYNHLKNLVGRSGVDTWLETKSQNPFLEMGKGGIKALLEAQKYAKGTMFSLSFFHQMTEGTHAIGHRVNPFKLKTQEIDLNDPKQFDAAKHGVMLRADRFSQQLFMQGVGADSYNLITKASRKFGGPVGEKLANLIDGYSHYLFEDYIPRLKMDTYEHILERNTGRYEKDLKSGKTTMDNVKSLSADQANAAYGHLNYAKLGHSPTLRHILQIALLAPDFFEARARFAGQAAKGFAGSKAGVEQLQALALLAAIQYIGARFLNQVDHGDAEWDPERAFQIKTDMGGLLPAERWLGLRSVPEDIHKFVADPGQFFGNRLAPITALLFRDTLFKVDWRGEKSNFSEGLKDMIAGIVPLPFQGFTNPLFQADRAGNISPGEQMLKSTGIQIHRVSPLSDAYQMSKDWLKVNNRRAWDKREKFSHPQSQYTALRYALEDGDKEKAKEEAKKLGDKATVTKGFKESIMRQFTSSLAEDNKMLKSLSKHNREIFKAAIKRRSLILQRYNAWVGSTGKTDVSEAGMMKRIREAKMKETLEE